MTSGKKKKKDKKLKKVEEKREDREVTGRVKTNDTKVWKLNKSSTSLGSLKDCRRHYVLSFC